MPPNGPPFQIVERQIPDVFCHPDGLVGVVKVQMPEQCDDSGMLFRIRNRDRERNLRIIQNTIARFGNWAQQASAPAILLFPELSVSEEATDWLRAEMATANIAPNTLIVLGVEHLRTDQFARRAADSHSNAEFAKINFGPNVDRVNTAAILAKDRSGAVHCYYQPKFSRSDYESHQQFTSPLIYEFAFGQHRFLVNVCSDFFLQAGARPLVGSVMLDVDRLHPQHGEHRLDLILLIQKNPSPLNDLYHASVRCLFYNTPHRLDTRDTIICAVNSANSGGPGTFGKSTVSVMRRGRPPEEYASKRAFEQFAWCSHKTAAAHLNEDLHYVRWRLRSPGAISFILDTDRRPWFPGNRESLPIRQPGLHKFTDADALEPVSPIPEIYELQEVLYNGFDVFIHAVFQVDELRRYFGDVAGYESLLNRLCASSPRNIIDLLLVLQDVCTNCDHWNMVELADAFRHFVLTLRLLSERYDDFCVVEGQLRADARTFGIMDCNQHTLLSVIGQLKNLATKMQDIDVLLVQRMSERPLWDGAPTSVETLQNTISTTKAAGVGGAAESVSRAPSPQIADIGALIAAMNSGYARVNDTRILLNEFLRFA